MKLDFLDAAIDAARKNLLDQFSKSVRGSWSRHGEMTFFRNILNDVAARVETISEEGENLAFNLRWWEARLEELQFSPAQNFDPPSNADLNLANTDPEFLRLCGEIFKHAPMPKPF